MSFPTRSPRWVVLLLLIPQDMPPVETFWRKKRPLWEEEAGDYDNEKRAVLNSFDFLYRLIFPFVSFIFFSRPIPLKKGPFFNSFKIYIWAIFLSSKSSQSGEFTGTICGSGVCVHRRGCYRAQNATGFPEYVRSSWSLAICKFLHYFFQKSRNMLLEKKKRQPWSKKKGAYKGGLTYLKLFVSTREGRLNCMMHKVKGVLYVKFHPLLNPHSFK